MNTFSHKDNTHWKDNPMDYKIINQEINSNTVFEIKMAQGGGFTMEILLLK